MPRKDERPHRAALTRMFRATGVVHLPDEAPLVELLRTLADEMDAGGGSRVQAQYRAALKDLRGVLNEATQKPRRKPAPPDPTVAAAEKPSEPAGPPKPDNLLQFEQRHGIA